jgi:hypothetical protein
MLKNQYPKSEENTDTCNCSESNEERILAEVKIVLVPVYFLIF